MTRMKQAPERDGEDLQIGKGACPPAARGRETMRGQKPVDQISFPDSRIKNTGKKFLAVRSRRPYTYVQLPLTYPRKYQIHLFYSSTIRLFTSSKPFYFNCMCVSSYRELTRLAPQHRFSLNRHNNNNKIMVFNQQPPRLIQPNSSYSWISSRSIQLLGH